MGCHHASTPTDSDIALDTKDDAEAILASPLIKQDASLTKQNFINTSRLMCCNLLSYGIMKIAYDNRKLVISVLVKKNVKFITFK